MNNCPIIAVIIITDNEIPIDIKDLIINDYVQHGNDSGIDYSLLVDNKNVQEMEKLITNEKNESEDNIDCIPKTFANARQKPSYLIEKNTHIFGGIDDV